MRRAPAAVAQVGWGLGFGVWGLIAVPLSASEIDGWFPVMDSLRGVCGQVRVRVCMPVCACVFSPLRPRVRLRSRSFTPPPPAMQGGKFGLCLDASLDRGWTGTCDTYANPPLAASEVFRALRVEVWGFVLPHVACKSASPAFRGSGRARRLTFSSLQHSIDAPPPHSPSSYPPQAAPSAAWRWASLASWAA